MQMSRLVSKKIPFKEFLCDMCVNNSLLLDALMVGDLKYLHQSITENIRLSFCIIVDNCHTCRKLNISQDPKLIIDHNHDFIYLNCKKCGAIQFQEGVIKANAENNIDWSKIVNWHQWQKATLKNP